MILQHDDKLTDQWSINLRIRAMFPPQRSGNVLIDYKYKLNYLSNYIYFYASAPKVPEALCFRVVRPSVRPSVRMSVFRPDLRPYYLMEFHQTWYRGPPPGVDELIRFWARSAQRQGSKVNGSKYAIVFYFSPFTRSQVLLDGISSILVQGCTTRSRWTEWFWARSVQRQRSKVNELGIYFPPVNISKNPHQTWYRGAPLGVDELIRFWARSAQCQGSQWTWSKYAIFPRRNSSITWWNFPYRGAPPGVWLDFGRDPPNVKQRSKVNELGIMLFLPR